MRRGSDVHVPPVIEDVATTRTVDQPGWVKRQTSAGWTVPEGWRFENLGACRTCGTPVAWCWTKAGKRAPVEKDGTPHFARCPQASAAPVSISHDVSSDGWVTLTIPLSEVTLNR